MIAITTPLLRVLGAGLGVAVMAGCAQPQPKPLYYWGTYQDQVNAYFKNKDGGYDRQILALEADIEKARAKNAAMLPGFHAHLGMLYGQVGKESQLVDQLAIEKRQFPESSGFIDFLMRKYQAKGESK
jgi:hypothetical protein